MIVCYFFFNDTATTEIYTLSLHDALPISAIRPSLPGLLPRAQAIALGTVTSVYDALYVALAEMEQCELVTADDKLRSEEHTSELQSRQYLVCRLLLEKKK